MAYSRTHTTVEDVVTDFKYELRGCELAIEAIDLNHLETMSFENKLQTFSDYILLVNNIAAAAIKCLEFLGICAPQPFSAILLILTNAIRFYFYKDVAYILMEKLDQIMSEELAIRCRATCRRISLCARYIQDMPETDDIGENRFQLQLLASHFPVHDALTDVLELGDRIQHIVREKEMKKFKELVFYFQLYFFLTTYTELYLLQIIAVMEKYGENSSPIKGVLKRHRDYDKDVLKIVYRPTMETIEVYINCELEKWSSLNSFLTRRRLPPEIYLDTAEKYTIMPLADQTKCFALWTVFQHKIKSGFLDNSDDSWKSYRYFDFMPDFSRDGTDIKSYTMRVLGTNISGCPASLNLQNNMLRKLQILKVFHKTDAERPVFLIRLAERSEQYLYYNEGMTFCKESVERNHKYKQHYSMCQMVFHFTSLKDNRDPNIICITKMFSKPFERFFWKLIPA